MEENSAIPSSRVPLVPGPAHPPGKHFPAKPVSMWGWGCLSRVGWWSWVWSLRWAPRGWGWEKCQSNPETESRTWNICSVGCGRGNLGHRGFLACCFPYYLPIPFKKSNWACCAIFHNLSMQNCARKLNWIKATVPVQHRRDSGFLASPGEPLYSHLGDALSTGPFIEGSWEKAVGRQQKKQKEIIWKVPQRWMLSECGLSPCLKLGQDEVLSFEVQNNIQLALC